MATGGEIPKGEIPKSDEPSIVEKFIDTPEDKALISAVKHIQLETEQ